jgi:hypothetical protein
LARAAEPLLSGRRTAQKPSMFTKPYQRRAISSGLVNPLWFAIVKICRSTSMASGETKSVRRSLSRACRTSRPSSYREGQRLFHFDPTNRSVGGFNLIPVAVARDIRQAMPAIRPRNEALHAFPRPPPWRLTSLPVGGHSVCALRPAVQGIALSRSSAS